MSALAWISLGLAGVWLTSEVLLRWTVRRGAHRALDDHGALFQGTHEYVPVQPSAFARLDEGFYDAVRNELTREGFTFLGDVENVTASAQMPKMRTFIRAMSGDYGAIIAGCYHVVLRGWQAPLQWLGAVPRRLQVLDLETELSDGTWVVTSNTLNLDTTPEQPEVAMLRLPLQTPRDELLRTHRERLLAALAERDVQVERAFTLDEALAAVDRLQALRNRVVGSREGLVAIIEQTPGHAGAKQLLIDEVQRTH